MTGRFATMDRRGIYHFIEENPLHGPVWNNPNVGVTGEPVEPGFRTNPPNYVTTRDADGNLVTLTGDAARAAARDAQVQGDLRG